MTRHHVYRCFDAEGQALYVGLSAKVWTRLKSHRSAPWSHQVDRVKITVHPSQEEGRKVEVREINRLEPLYNGEVHLFDTIDWDPTDFYEHAYSLAEYLEADTISQAHPIGRLEVYYRRKFGRSLLTDMGSVMVQRRGRINDPAPVPVMLHIRGTNPQDNYTK